MSRLACFLDPGRSLDEGAERARAAESLGYERVFATQTVFWDPLQVLALYAARTTTIGIGTGVVPIPTRHPFQLAIEAATLDAASGGRFALGIGISHKITVEDAWGLTLDYPVDRMEEYTSILRSLFQNGAVGHEGRFYTTKFVLASGARPNIPIYFAALGPRMLNLAARVADGVILWMCSPQVIRDSIRPALDAGLKEAGRSWDDFDIVAAVPTALTENPEGAAAKFLDFAKTYASLPFYRKEIARGGLEDELAAFDERGVEGLSQRFVSTFAGIGDAAAVQAKVAEYRDAGVTLPAVAVVTRHEGGASAEDTFAAAAGA